MTPDEILAAQESCLRAQGDGDAVIEPRMHLMPDPAFRGHFNVLRGYIASLGVAGVKIVGDFVDNYQRGLPSELATLNLMDARTGTPRAVIDATAITDMRTGAMKPVEIWSSLYQCPKPFARCSQSMSPLEDIGHRRAEHSHSPSRTLGFPVPAKRLVPGGVR